jgi:hypothetical protein
VGGEPPTRAPTVAAFADERTFVRRIVAPSARDVARDFSGGQRVADGAELPGAVISAPMNSAPDPPLACEAGTGAPSTLLSTKSTVGFASSTPLGLA